MVFNDVHETKTKSHKIPGTSSVTTKDVQSAVGRQRCVYKGAADEESAQPSSLPTAAACQASSLRSTGNIVFVSFKPKLFTSFRAVVSVLPLEKRIVIHFNFSTVALFDLRLFVKNIDKYVCLRLLIDKNVLIRLISLKFRVI